MTYRYQQLRSCGCRYVLIWVGHSIRQTTKALNVLKFPPGTSRDQRWCYNYGHVRRFCRRFNHCTDLCDFAPFLRQGNKMGAPYWKWLELARKVPLDTCSNCLGRLRKLGWQRAWRLASSQCGWYTDWKNNWGNWREDGMSIISRKLERADFHNIQVPTSDFHAHPAKDDLKGSREVESGTDLLDNNAVNVLMAAIMSVGGMLIMSYVWDLPVKSIVMWTGSLCKPFI